MGSQAQPTFAILPARGVLALGGADARDFLQNLVTNELRPLDTGAGVHAALLSPQGKYLFDFFIVAEDDRLLLDVEAARREDLIKRLTMYRLRADVAIEDESEALVVAALMDSGEPPAIDGARVFADPRLPAAGHRAILPRAEAGERLRAAGFEEASAEDYDRHRLALGLADGGADMEVDKTTILEANFKELHGVDFDKGCYVGQEVTARMNYRGLVRKRLLPVAIDGAAPPPGTPLMRQGKEVGAMRSSRGDLGLALIRLDRLGDWWQVRDAITAGDAAITPEKPEWLDLDG